MNHIRCDIAHFQQMPETYRQVIREILMECDEEFVPPLSMRRSPWQTNLGEQDFPVTYDGIASYMHDMQEEAFLVATVPGTDEVMAFLAYMPGHVHPDETDGLATDYVSTICTRHR